MRQMLSKHKFLTNVVMHEFFCKFRASPSDYSHNLLRDPRCGPHFSLRLQMDFDLVGKTTKVMFISVVKNGNDTNSFHQ